MESKNKCPKCGGRLVAEFIGNYGDIFLLNKDGSGKTRRMKRMIYEHDGDPPMIYCIDCGEGYERTE